MSFQQIIEALNLFWARQNCLIGQPYGVEVGAGTGNPHTFFRVLGPEPYNVAYVEPSRRPTDGRYGQSPNRFQHYYQYQVILKPAPKFNQELFIESLVAIGLDPRKHDIRFVEDNWESTPLGAWGLGWEVWCDGMEIAQYTYFQQMAGTPLVVPTLEITYGLERLAMYIQDVDHYKDMKWNDMTTYADIFERHEYWQAKHNFETSTPEALQKLYAIYEAEVVTQLERKNYWAAYDYQLKLSHVFNLLDARGMISVSDRVAKFGLMSKNARAISTMYLEEREAMGYPLKKHMAPMTYRPQTIKLELGAKNTKYQKNIAVVELGFEEIPASYLTEWSEVLTHAWFKQKLRENGVTFRKAYLYLTPRRIVMKVVQPSKQGRVVQSIKGMNIEAAYDSFGKPTMALEGFLKSKELKIKELKIREENGKKFVVADRAVVKSLSEVFQGISDAVLASAPKTKWMFWAENVPTFIRPLRSIIAFHNSSRISIKLLNIETGKKTSGPRYELPAEYEINSAQDYFKFIREKGIILSSKKRMRRITHECATPGDTIGKFSDMVVKNAYLTENPHTQALQLEKRYMELPIELVTLILEKNQMYPMTREKDGTLWYHVVANHRRVHARIAHGNQKVAKARLEDGVFYFQQDLQKKLSEYSDGLRNVGFHPKAGTYFEKKQRIADLVKKIYQQLGKAVPETVTQALKLIKNDKATALGKEFPSLEGVIGRSYALREGVPENVADLLADHYLPEELGGKVPATEEAKVISLADKLDTLLTLVQVEKLPEGNHDPFEIRKTVYRLLTLLIDRDMKFELTEIQPELATFIGTRFEQMLLECGVEQWIARAVSKSESRNYADLSYYAKKLSLLTQDEQIRTTILDTFKRVRNILTQSNWKMPETLDRIEKVRLPPESEPKLESAERELALYVSSRIGIGFTPQEILDLAKLLERFFKEVMVMDKDTAKRERRLHLLALVQRLMGKKFSLSFT